MPCLACGAEAYLPCLATGAEAYLLCLAEQGRNIICANGPGPHLHGKPTSTENPRPRTYILSRAVAVHPRCHAAATVRFVHLVGARANCPTHTRVAPWLPENGTIQPSRHPSWHQLRDGASSDVGDLRHPGPRSAREPSRCRCGPDTHLYFQRYGRITAKLELSPDCTCLKA